jgi:hypothetical protein
MVSYQCYTVTHSLIGPIGCTFWLAVYILNMLLIDIFLLHSQVTLAPL